MLMKNYYSTLEVSTNASEIDIKRAYFNLVRRYPPDRYPDDFKKIREAYEILIDEQTRSEYDSIDSMPGVVKLYFNAGKNALDGGDNKKAIKLLEKVTATYPDFNVINSLLGDAYLSNENSGKALKIFEKLVFQEPSNAGFAGKLAHAYHERGWHIRAIDKYKSALALDEDNISLWLGLISCYMEADDINLASSTANEAIKVSERNDWDSLEIYIELLQIDIMIMNEEDFSVHLDNMKNTALKYEDNKNNVAWFLVMISKFLQASELDHFAASTITTAYELMPDDKEIREIYEDIIKENILNQMIEKLQLDNSFPETFVGMFECEIRKCDESNCLDCRFQEFTFEMDIVYDMISHRKHINRLKELYPELYNLKKDFFDRVLDISQSKKITWEYEKKLKKFAKLCPEKMFDDADDDYMPQEPIRREGKKIGRNDPCPCGSGKKYKKCCGQ